MVVTILRLSLSMKLRLKSLLIGSLLKAKIVYLLAKNIEIQLHILKYVNPYHVREATFSQ